MERVEVSFPSGGQQCAAWLYRPDGVPKPRPLVVMGHGLGANREMGLDRYARRFTAAGMGVLVFDYRHFGASDGEPRQMVHIARQREDWHAAIAYARTVKGFDATRIALWGTSFGGGHVLSVAPDDSYIAAVVAQVPFISGFSSALAKGPVSLTKVATIAATDMLLGPIRRKPVPVRLAGRKRAAALMSAPDVPEGFGRLSEESESYLPKVAARVAFSALFDSPGKHAKQLKMPVMYALADNDSIAPVKRALKAAKHTKHATVKRYPAGHFDLYFDDMFEQAVRDQTEFLTSILRP
ncbi:alpha/beta hydrolase [Nocardia donostiensis]|uniref:Alpha/beta hydrolase n=1 Tax=Nocardia donostiensis TaxID=1538463 RepID=A0A1V2TGQ7_9NOCA|nr:alpha/beta fold hydrolase [Nocardia donostiensis]ONM48664.1 alpha/beta hydrolase [Nocardia donostiensis]OQS16853.1 alpha/beta hydrolase [Nocardia donostiensis]OQS23318.1 alpha/beta hydrolase [Nocardia donostiensis]